MFCPTHRRHFLAGTLASAAACVLPTIGARAADRAAAPLSAGPARGSRRSRSVGGLLSSLAGARRRALAGLAGGKRRLAGGGAAADARLRCAGSVGALCAAPDRAASRRRALRQ